MVSPLGETMACCCRSQDPNASTRGLLLADAATFCPRRAVDLVLDGEQRIDAGDGLDADRRLVEPG